MKIFIFPKNSNINLIGLEGIHHQVQIVRQLRIVLEFNSSSIMKTSNIKFFKHNLLRWKTHYPFICGAPYRRSLTLFVANSFCGLL